MNAEWGLEPFPQEKGGGYFVTTYFSPCREGDLPLLAKVKGLRAFYNYERNVYSPEGWEAIGRIPDLETLTFEAYSLDDAHVSGLKQAPHLKDLQLFEFAEKKHRLTGSSFESLQNLKHLQRLDGVRNRSSFRRCSRGFGGSTSSKQVGYAACCLRA